MKRFLFILLTVLFFAGQPLYAETIPAGIPGDRLWFSKEPFFAGDKITVHTFIFNSGKETLYGIIELRDGTTTLAKKDFTVPPNGGSQAVSFPWEATAGSHKLYAEITEQKWKRGEDLTVHIPELFGERTAQNVIVVGFDKDGDGIADPPPQLAAIATTSSSSLPRAVEEIKEKLPEPVKEKITPIIGHVERFRIDQVEDSALRMRSIEQKLGSTSTDPLAGGWETIGAGVKNKQVWKSPVEYLKLFGLLLWHIVVKYPIVFYVFILLVIFKLVRFILRLFF